MNARIEDTDLPHIMVGGYFAPCDEILPVLISAWLRSPHHIPRSKCYGRTDVVTC